MSGVLDALVWCSFPDAMSARTAAQQLLQEGLIACANMMPEVEPVFVWEGQFSATRESATLFKTNSDNLAALVTRPGGIHPYDTPSVFGWHCDAAHPTIMNWLGDTLGE